jgi:anti-sigma factor RsiW
MSECRDLKERMHEALDGELSAADRQALMDHIAGCGECEATWRMLGAADGMLARAPMAAPAAGFAARVRVRAEMRRQARRVRLGWLALSLGTLLVATIVGVLSLVWLQDSMGSVSPATLLGYGPKLAEGFFGMLGALARGAWLFVRGLVLYSHVNWLLLAVAAMSLATGLWFVASHLVQESMAARQQVTVAIRKGI